MLQEFDNNKDHHSFANVDSVRVSHISLDLEVDFTRHQLSGHVDLSLVYIEPAEFDGQLWLDTRDLCIEKVTDAQGNSLAYTLSEPDVILGAKLSIILTEKFESVRVYYMTSPSAQGLQWLAPEQTAGRSLPYLFSQSQPINARSWIPLQDSPKARITFDAHIQAPIGMRVVMSAMNDADAALNGEFTFSMEKPIPTHLLAIAVGDLAFGVIGPRTGVYTEPSMLAAAVKEFEDTEHMVCVAESLLGPYPWGRYDMIVLPPSFPFGGMENPRLAFMTPTLIAGDKSLVSTVAHELAHSWTGNLVSNATWRDLWLNEGFTTYFTNRIVEAVFGKEQAELELMIEFGRLSEELASLPLKEQTLPANVQTRDPNLAFNRFTYDKASMFVHELEQRLGRENFDAFLYQYVQHFAFQAITTETFVGYAEQTLLRDYQDVLSKAELDEWIYGKGMPHWFVAPKSASLDKVEDALSQWLAGSPAATLRINDWRVHHWQYFLEQLPEQLTQAQLIDLDGEFNFSGSTNAEIACDWFRVAIRNQFDPVLPAVSAFLTTVGRGKFVRPLYSELQLAGYQQELLSIYSKARSGYHPSIQVQLDKALNYQ